MKNKLENQLKELINSAKKTKKGLISLKDTAVTLDCLELAAELREMQENLFPETTEQKDAKKAAEELRLLFGMVKLNIPPDVCWKISESMKIYSKKKKKFALEDAAKIIAKHQTLFEDE